MSADTDDAARRAAQETIAAERGGVFGYAAELARLHAQVADLTSRVEALEP
jgi:hypothetical protein